MLPLEIDSLSPDWYVGNFHKWVCGPPCAGFLWVNDSRIATTHPMAVSHFYQQGFINEFDWQGTRDITPILGASISVQWGEQFGWDRIREHNHQLVVMMQEELVTKWDVVPMSPRDGSMLGSMASVKLPFPFPPDLEEANQLRVWLYEECQIEIAVLPWQNDVYVRVSAQLYTAMDDIQLLIDALEAYKLGFSGNFQQK
jgi:isopenicillin-N epimerase